MASPILCFLVSVFSALFAMFIIESIVTNRFMIETFGYLSNDSDQHYFFKSVHIVLTKYVLLCVAVLLLALPDFPVNAVKTILAYSVSQV